MNIENLTKLAEYLGALPPDYEHFKMTVFVQDAKGNDLEPRQFTSSPHHCGTTACAIGHGPNAGILPLESDYSWRDYSDRVFNLNYREWLWCFSDEWHEIDNTPQGAAKRIRHLIEHGLPEDALKQQQGKAPYLFANTGE